MTFFAPRYARVWFPLGVVTSVLQIVLAAIMVSRGETAWVWWLNLLVPAFLLVFFARLSYLTMFVPVVQIDEQAIRWRAMVGRRFQRVNLDEIVGHRFQDSFDLRLQLRTGDERSIHLSQVAKRHRSLLVAAIQEIVGKRTAAI